MGRISQSINKNEYLLIVLIFFIQIINIINLTNRGYYSKFLCIRDEYFII